MAGREEREEIRSLQALIETSPGHVRDFLQSRKLSPEAVKDEDERNPFHWLALASGKFALPDVSAAFDALVLHFPDLITRCDEDEYSPLYVAVAADNSHVVRLLLRHSSDAEGADPTWKKTWQNAKNGNTVFHAAKSLKMLQILINAYSESPSGKVDTTNSIDSVDLRGGNKEGLLEKENNSGQTPLQRAVIAGKREITEMLIKAGANVRQLASRTEDNLLHYAVAEKDREMMRFLVAQSPDLATLKNRRGDTPLDSNDREITSYLKDLIQQKRTPDQEEEE